MSLVILNCLTFASCGDEKTLVTDKGEQVEYDITELIEDGFYSMDVSKKSFVSLMTGASGFQGIIIEHNPSRYIWLGNNEADLIKLIPEIDNKKTKLVVVGTEADSLPDTYVLEKYSPLGYTIGTTFSTAESGDTLYMHTTDTCESSMAAGELKNSSADMFPIHKINDSKNIPLDNIDPDINMLLGLEKNKTYKLSIFKGTQYKELELVADTLVFKSVDFIELDTPFEVTDEGYFFINLPKNLKNGYYYINDYGLFKYTGDTYVSTPAEEASEASTPTEDEQKASDASSKSPAAETSEETVREGSVPIAETTSP